MTQNAVKWRNVKEKLVVVRVSFNCLLDISNALMI